MEALPFFATLILLMEDTAIGTEEKESMFSTGFSAEYQRLLKKVTPSFEQNLIRAFKNEGVRNQAMSNKNWYIEKMDSAFVTIDDTKIELQNLKLLWIPDFRLAPLSVDFNMLCLDVVAKLGDLQVVGEYDATNVALLKILPVSNVGNIEFIFKGVIAKGKVGLLVKADSLVPENYDIDYEPSESSLIVKYFINAETQIENKIYNKKGEDLLQDVIWKQLKDILTQKLDRQLREAMVQFSLSELLADQDDELRQLAREHSSRANRLLDSLSCTAKDYLVAMNSRSIVTPPFDVVYRGRNSGLFQGKLFTENGYIQDLSTLTRSQDLSFFETKEKLVIYGSLTLNELKHGFEHFSSEFEDVEVSGGIKTTIYRNRIFIRLSVIKEAECFRTALEDVHVSTIKDIDVDASGLASLSWLLPKIESWVVGNLRYSAIPVLERYIREAFEYAIAKTHCVSLLH